MNWLLAVLLTAAVSLLTLAVVHLRRRNRAWRQSSRLYSALTHINQAIVRLPTQPELFERVCRVLVNDAGFRLAWITWHDAARQALVPVAQCGDTDGFLDGVRIYTDDRPEGRGPSGTAFRENRPIVRTDLLRDPGSAPWRSEMRARRFQAAAAFPIRVSGVPAGTLSVISDDRTYFRDREIALLVEAAADVSFGLDNIARERARREAAQAAENERRFSQSLIESVPGILYLYDEDGQFLRWNRRFEEVSGCTNDEVARAHPLQFFSSDDQALLTERIGRVFSEGEASVEASFVAKDGTAIPYLFTGRRITFEGATCLVGMGIDISERRQAEDERARADAALREVLEGLEVTVATRTAELQAALVRAEGADRIKSAFLATMSHELRTPLNSIIGFTGVLLQGLAGPLNDEQLKQLGMVRTSARHLLELIGDVLDISKIEAGQLEVRSEPVDLASSISRVVGLVRPMIEGKGLTLHVEMPQRLSPLLSDRRRIEQILLNLMNNAAKFTMSGGVTLTAEDVGVFRLRPNDPPGAAVRLRVADTGSGIKPDDLATLFQPFRQIDTGLTRQHEGTGLGLAICRRLVALLGGMITVDSTWGTGSTFTVTLPLAKRTS